MFRRITFSIICFLCLTMFGFASISMASTRSVISSDRDPILGVEHLTLAEMPNPLSVQTLSSALGYSLLQSIPTTRLFGRWPIPIEAVSSKGFVSEPLNACICSHSVSAQERPWLFYGIKEHRIRV